MHPVRNHGSVDRLIGKKLLHSGSYIAGPGATCGAGQPVRVGIILERLGSRLALGIFLFQLINARQQLLDEVRLRLLRRRKRIRNRSQLSRIASERTRLGSPDAKPRA